EPRDIGFTAIRAGLRPRQRRKRAQHQQGQPPIPPSHVPLQISSPDAAPGPHRSLSGPVAPLLRSIKPPLGARRAFAYICRALRRQVDAENSLREPFVPKLLLRIADRANIRIELEPEFGYAGRIVFADGTSHPFKAGNLNINRGGAMAIADDKSYTSF